MNKDDEIKLKVGGEDFTASRAELKRRCQFLREYLKGLNPSEHHIDQVFRLDMDAYIFSHVLRHVRHGTFPYLATSDDEVDVEGYQMLAQQAATLGITVLSNKAKELLDRFNTRPDRKEEVYKAITETYEEYKNMAPHEYTFQKHYRNELESPPKYTR